jgi:hypothetical protein
MKRLGKGRRGRRERQYLSKATHGRLLDKLRGAGMSCSELT